MIAAIKLIQYGDSIMHSAAEICSSSTEAEEFIEFIFNTEKLSCKKCNHEFDYFTKKLLVGIDETLQHKNNLYATQ